MDTIFNVPKQSDLETLLTVSNDIQKAYTSKAKGLLEKRIHDKNILCIYINNEIVGYIHWKNVSTRDKDLYIEQITISQESRGMGLGNKLLKYFIDQASKLHISKIYTHIQSYNIVSKKLFTNHGFRKTSNEIVIDDAIIDNDHELYALELKF